MLELEGQESNFISDVRKGILPAGGSSGALRSPSLWPLPFGLPGFLQRSSYASPREGKGPGLWVCSCLSVHLRHQLFMDLMQWARGMSGKEDHLRTVAISGKVDAP